MQQACVKPILNHQPERSGQGGPDKCWRRQSSDTAAGVQAEPSAVECPAGELMQQACVISFLKVFQIMKVDLVCIKLCCGFDGLPLLAANSSAVPRAHFHSL